MQPDLTKWQEFPADIRLILQSEKQFTYATGSLHEIVADYEMPRNRERWREILENTPFNVEGFRNLDEFVEGLACKKAFMTLPLDTQKRYLFNVRLAGSYIMKQVQGVKDLNALINAISWCSTEEGDYWEYVFDKTLEGLSVVSYGRWTQSS